MDKHRGRLHFSTDINDALEHARLLFVAVGTPPSYSGDADLSAVFSVVDAMPPEGEHALVMKSTVPVGTGRAIKRRFEETGRSNFRYVSCPEFLKEGSAVKDFLNPDRVVIGDDGDWAGDAVEELYAPLEAPILRMDIASAEMVKLASNAFLATKISFINEIANVSEETGADVGEVARGMGLDDRIGPKFLQPGIGFGGSCFPKDVSALKQLAGNSGYHFQLLSAVIEVNELQKRRVIGKLKRSLGSLVGKRIALLGLAFKPNTDDMREASSLVLAGRLQGEGAEVVAFDPIAMEEARELMPHGVDFADDELGARRATPTRSCSSPSGRSSPSSTGARSPRAMRGDVVIDGRNALDAEAIRARRACATRAWAAAAPAKPPSRRSSPAPTSSRPPSARGRASAMQAVILVGGEGTRLRPLTSTVPKPVMPLVDRPFMAYMLEWLHRHGVDDVVLSMGYLATAVRNVLGDGSAYGLKITLRRGARAARHRRRAEVRRVAARRALLHAQRRRPDRHGPDRAARAQHEATGARGTLALVPVDDPSSYGLVRARTRTSRCSEFVEKPSSDQIDTNLISAGAYILERDVVDLIPPDENVSIEREIWPQLVGDGLYGFAARARVLARHRHPGALPAGHVRHHRGRREDRGDRAAGRRLRRRSPTASTPRGPRRAARGGRARLLDRRGRARRVARRARRRRLGRRATRGSSARSSCRAPRSARARCCATASSRPGAKIGARTHITGGAVLGEGVTVGADNMLTRGVRVFPHVEIPDGAIRF